MFKRLTLELNIKAAAYAAGQIYSNKSCAKLNVKINNLNRNLICVMLCLSLREWFKSLEVINRLLSEFQLPTVNILRLNVECDVNLYGIW